MIIIRIREIFEATNHKILSKRFFMRLGVHLFPPLLLAIVLSACQTPISESDDHLRISAALDKQWNRNMFSGKNPATNILLKNNYDQDIANAELWISLRALDVKTGDINLRRLETEKIPAGGEKTLKYFFNLPENIKTGHYSLVLKTKHHFQGRRALLSNEYKIFILNRKDIKLKVAPKNGVALLQGSKLGTKRIAAILKTLKVPFRLIRYGESLENFKIIILPPCGSLFPETLAPWLKQGGKLLSFARVQMPNGIPQRTRKNSQNAFFTDLVKPNHPVLRGLKQADFTYWNGESDNIANKRLSNYVLLPIRQGMIASQNISGNKKGMTIAEYRVGEGVCMLTQLEAVKRFRTDSVATLYLINTLNYCLGDWNAANAAPCKILSAFSLDPKDAFFIDLRKACTMGFADTEASDGKGGWTDQGPMHDLHNLPTGKQTFNGVPFEIINPKSNKGKSCVVLRGQSASGTGFLPLKKRIIVNRKAETLYFLVISAWTPKKGKMASLKISLKADASNKTSTLGLDLLSGVNITDWSRVPIDKPSEAELGWVGFIGNETDKNKVGSLIVEWRNPSPEKTIQHIDFESEGKAVPAILAITGLKVKGI